MQPTSLPQLWLLSVLSQWKTGRVLCSVSQFAQRLCTKSSLLWGSIFLKPWLRHFPHSSAIFTHPPIFTAAVVLWHKQIVQRASVSKPHVYVTVLIIMITVSRMYQNDHRWTLVNFSSSNQTHNTYLLDIYVLFTDMNVVWHLGLLQPVVLWRTAE